ncbi:hypothetical protein BGW36DRAFT_374619 [Talaromyces proteolyticus]|uniref:LisH domain-containing protein n=1 Tax=Talaromyces proteolyticus TaxID=1131652 RepID=A0AAD4KWR8_9EURO|nr:uncharacterized protein BGW36DRAFT_374619 [Talaromyces proteolyticus]KAH8700637.1 hypothetical protein BGW36DRAFT_374619 [Talaromyces proteolyticus]
MVLHTQSAPSVPIASILVARFLRSNNYTESLNTFIREAGLPSDVGQTAGRQVTSKSIDDPGNADQWTLEDIIQEKKRFDHSLRFERYGESQSQIDKWNTRAPSQPKVIETPSSTNILSVSVGPWRLSEEQTSEVAVPYIVATGADKRLSLFNADADNTTALSIPGLSDSPILSHTGICHGLLQLITNMSGQLLLVQNDQVIDRRNDHNKYAVQVKAYEDQDNHVWITTAGWDARVFIYRMELPSPSNEAAIGDPVGTIKLPTNPESILIVRNPENQELVLLVSRRDSTYIYFYSLEHMRSINMLVKCEESGKQNLAPHSNAWVAFSPSCLALSPHNPGLIAVALSTLPHMKVMIVRLLFPSGDDRTITNNDKSNASVEATMSLRTDESTSESHLTQAMTALALQNREDAAIIIQTNTLAPQTAYSTPQVVWRPDGSGLWVNGDDGIIRGVEAKTGKVVTILENGHEAGSKVRSIWAGWVSSKDSKEEWVVSGGFDKRLIVWK